jgi:hypothetical protein
MTQPPAPAFLVEVTVASKPNRALRADIRLVPKLAGVPSQASTSNRWPRRPAELVRPRAEKTRSRAPEQNEDITETTETEIKIR